MTRFALLLASALLAPSALAQVGPAGPSDPVPAPVPAPAHAEPATPPAPPPEAARAAPPAAATPAPQASPLPPAVAPGLIATGPTSTGPIRLGPVELELGGWLLWGTYVTYGGLDSPELPRAAVAPPTEHDLGMTVRQSRVRAALGLPAGGLLSGAQLTGLVEIDFMGGSVGGDQSMPLVRFRQGYVAVTWKQLANLTLLLGQTWGLVGESIAPASLAHYAVPRFSGAGYLYRRAPQLRVSAESGGAVSLLVAGALLAPMDTATTPAPTPADPDLPPPTSVGERSGLPDAEGRVALRWQPADGRRLEVGLTGHVGRERWLLMGAGGYQNATVDAYGGGLDLKLDLAWLTVQGGGYLGKNLDILNTLSAGVTLSLNAAGLPVAATGVAVSGGWAQVLVRPVAPLTLLAGAGVEVANAADLPANPPSGTVPVRNLQLSGGALLELTPRWQAGVEYTAYLTRYLGPPDRDINSAQLEVATRYAF